MFFNSHFQFASIKGLEFIFIYNYIINIICYIHYTCNTYTYKIIAKMTL